MELKSLALEVLQQVEIRRGQIVLDFGYGPGTYAIPAAKIVGEQGRVYAFDKAGKPIIDLIDESMNIVLLFDVFQSHYFPQSDDRRKLLNEIYRIMKSSTFISVWPKHMESAAKDEIENANFYLKSDYSGTLIPDNNDL